MYKVGSECEINSFRTSEQNSIGKGSNSTQANFLWLLEGKRQWWIPYVYSVYYVYSLVYSATLISFRQQDFNLNQRGDMWRYKVYIERKYDTEQTMKLDRLHIIGPECELNSWSDRSVS